MMTYDKGETSMELVMCAFRHALDLRWAFMCACARVALTRNFHIISASRPHLFCHLLQHLLGAFMLNIR